MNTPSPVPSTPRHRGPFAEPRRPARPVDAGPAPSGPGGPARRPGPDPFGESWKLGAQVIRLTAQLPVLGVLHGLSLLGRAADAWHARRHRR